ncbi:MAG TPA: TadE/TadG family type IV pilus assembly protein [Acidimicrobiia bacterium]|nr:TadE/TadG family type IV pilus assembly protein [Acidimicrobiia bacterium]
MPCTRSATPDPPVADDERGSALVEFALILPLVLMLAFGIVTSALIYNHKIDLTHAAREGARYGATLAQLQCSGSPNPCGTKTWAAVVQAVVVERAFGDITAADVCVSLVTGNPGAVIASGFSVNSPHANGTCYSDGNDDPGKRVQVAIRKTGEAINGILFRIPVTLTSQATAKFEQ